MDKTKIRCRKKQIPNKINMKQCHIVFASFTRSNDIDLTPKSLHTHTSVCERKREMTTWLMILQYFLLFAHDISYIK